MIQDDINTVEYSYLYYTKIFDQKTYDFIEYTQERDYLLHTHKGLQHTVSTLSSLVECCWHYSIYILETLNLMQFDSWKKNYFKDCVVQVVQQEVQPLVDRVC